MPPIAGVANAAMVLEDTTIMEMSLEVMNKVLRPKVDGSKYLDELFQEDTLDFFVMFSSLATVFGNHGQSNYTTANMFLNGLAAQRRAKGLAGSVIAIAALLGIGYTAREVSEPLLQRIRQGGYAMMSERDIHQLFAEAVLIGRPETGSTYEIITGLRIVKQGEEVSAGWFTNPMFQHVVLRQGGVDTSAADAASLKLPLRTQIVTAKSGDELRKMIQGQ
jgi:hybrid polyketide synthase / nonribosomal peptide synthetase ACE1